MAADVDGGVRDLKELLYRAEAERLQLQQQAAGLTNNKQQLTADVLKLRQQLAELHAAFTDSQQQVSQLTTARDKLQVQVKSAVTEYRANDIIAIGLRDQITRLEQKLKDSQYVCSEQVRTQQDSAMPAVHQPARVHAWQPVVALHHACSFHQQ